MEYKTYLASNHWIDKKKWFKSKVRNFCIICRTKENLHVHHERYYRKGKSILFNESKRDLKLLCKRCHFFIHENKLVQKLMAKKIRRKTIYKIIMDKENG